MPKNSGWAGLFLHDLLFGKHKSAIGIDFVTIDEPGKRPASIAEFTVTRLCSKRGVFLHLDEEAKAGGMRDRSVSTEAVGVGSPCIGVWIHIAFDDQAFRDATQR